MSNAEVIGAILAVLATVGTVFGFFRALESRLTALETWRKTVDTRIEALDQRIADRLANIERKQDDILYHLLGSRPPAKRS